MSNRNRNKGNNYERKIRLEFKDLGWINCETSRYKSKYLDDNKIDLTDTTPFSVQAKCTQNNPSYHKIFQDMLEQNGNYKIIYHKKSNERNKEYIILEKESWVEILQMLLKEKIINPK